MNADQISVVNYLTGCLGVVPGQWIILSPVYVLISLFAILNLNVSPTQVIWPRVVLICGLSLIFAPISLDALDVNVIPRGGTDIASAIHEAEAVFKTRTAADKILILITDGEDLGGEAITAAQSAGKNGVKIFTVGVGSTTGGLVPVPSENGGTDFAKDENGRPVKSRGLFARSALVLGLVFLYVPIISMVVFSFNNSRLVTVWDAANSPTLKWYGVLAHNGQILGAAWLSIRIALVAATGAVILGTLAGMALARFGAFRGRMLLAGMTTAPARVTRSMFSR